MQNKYNFLQQSNNSYQRFETLIQIINNNLQSNQNSENVFVQECFNAFNNLFEYISWLNNISKKEQIYSFFYSVCNQNDDFYKYLIDFGGYEQVFNKKDDIIKSNIIVLDNANENHEILTFNKDNQKDVCNILTDNLHLIKNTYCYEYNDDLNEILNKFCNCFL